MKFDLKNKKNLIILGVAVVAIIVVIAIVIMLTSKSGNNNDNKETNINLDKTLTELGKKFYEEQYYPGMDDKTILANFKDTGLNISITNLDVIVPIGEDVKKALDNKKCNYDNTTILIYPEAPYKATDYSLTVNLVCEEK